MVPEPTEQVEKTTGCRDGGRQFGSSKPPEDGTGSNSVQRTESP